jgi:DNA-binding LacI/PurR family transcriptional regulator
LEYNRFLIDSKEEKHYVFSMGKNKTTIADIAREAGVGLGTVSRVLNNSSHVSEATRAKVLDVVKAHQFKPSAAASRLARNEGSESTVGLLLPDIGNHFFFEIFEIIYRELRNRGVDLIIFNYEKHNKKVIQKILNAEMSALLIFAFQLDDTELDLLRNRNVRYLYVDYPAKSDNCIFTDNYLGGMLAARYLIDKGVKHPCYIAIDQLAHSNRERGAGFAHELSAKHVPFETFIGILSEESGYELTKKIISLEKFDGIFCYCDEIASGAIRAIREAASSLRIIGFDGLRLSRHIGVSTISQDPTRIGFEAANRIVQIMTKDEGTKELMQLQITPFLIDRNS